MAKVQAVTQRKKHQPKSPNNLNYSNSTKSKMTDQPLLDNDAHETKIETATKVNDNNEFISPQSSSNDFQALKPMVFKPNSVEQFVPVSDTELANLQNDDINDQANVWSRLYRIVLILFLNLVFLPLTAILKTQFHIFTIFGFAVLCCCLAYAAHLFYIIFKAYFGKKEGLYRVHTLNSIPPKWASMSIAYRALLIRHQPIESISEFSAIQGILSSVPYLFHG